MTAPEDADENYSHYPLSRSWCLTPAVLQKSSALLPEVIDLAGGICGICGISFAPFKKKTEIFYMEHLKTNT